MKFEFASCGKFFGALVTAEGFFAGMHSEMFGKLMLPNETFSTKFTSVWFLSGVKALMVFKVGGSGVALPTLVAGIHGGDGETGILAFNFRQRFLLFMQFPPDYAVRGTLVQYIYLLIYSFR